MKNRHRMLLAVALLLPAPAVAQVGQVTGTVLHHDRRPVAGASVALIPQKGSILYGTSTGTDGRYAFKGLRADTYSVVVLPPRGGIAVKDRVKVRGLFRSIVDFRLPSIVRDGPLPPPSQPGEDVEAGSFSFSCELRGPSRDAIPDADVILLPVEEDGAMRQARTSAEGRCGTEAVPDGVYRILARAPGFITWSISPIAMKGLDDLELTLSMVPYPMGFEGSLEDLLIAPEPIPPAEP